MNLKFALAGNPNAGKSSVFNKLTGLRQKVGNFPGVTVDKRIGTIVLGEKKCTVVDLPGTYSLYPNSQDERIVLNILANPNDENFPDVLIYIADLTNLERHLLLFTQVRDLNIPIILCVTMVDAAAQKNIFFERKTLEETLKVPVIELDGRTGMGISELKNEMLAFSQLIGQSISRIAKDQPVQRHPDQLTKTKMFYQPSPNELSVAEKIRFQLPQADNIYRAILIAHHYDKLPFLTVSEKKLVEKIVKGSNNPITPTQVVFEDLRLQIFETLQRFEKLQPILHKIFIKPVQTEFNLTDKIDRIVTNHIAGPLIFFTILFIIFQSIFAFAELPKTWIENSFVYLNSYLKSQLPANWMSDLLTNGILAGLSGVLAFIPQIAILFFLIAILEEVGYMARSVYLFDRIMQKVGLNGRSIVALVAGGACAIPAIMSTRTISNWKERLITILVTPFISCSARIPVYALLVGFVVKNEYWGIFNKQGLMFTFLYALGVVTSLSAAFVLKKVIHSHETTFLAIELPQYRMPHWRNIFFTVWEKVKTFITEAGKTIMVVAIFLWILATFSPTPHLIEKSVTDYDRHEQLVLSNEQTQNETADLKLKAQNLRQREDFVAAKKLEYSYAGYFGRSIEPAIRPLGFDWKIGIALLSSFAAREVFVGTMATIYSVGSAGDDSATIRERMMREKKLDGTLVYSTATALSLLIFYVFAMQCMSTLAVVKRETKSWKWPILQFVFMGALAYLGSFLAFHLMN